MRSRPDRQRGGRPSPFERAKDSAMGVGSIIGQSSDSRCALKFSAWPDRTELRSARLGEDNERVLRNYLDLSDTQSYTQAAC